MLASIDIVNLENCDISCFVFASGLSFEESTIKIGQSTLASNDMDGNEHLLPAASIPLRILNVFFVLFCYRFI